MPWSTQFWMKAQRLSRSSCHSTSGFRLGYALVSQEPGTCSVGPESVLESKSVAQKLGGLAYEAHVSLALEEDGSGGKRGVDGVDGPGY
eukprot:1432497-Rhodomonas_salina.1